MNLKNTKLLKDVPTALDAFGTHKRIADLLHEEIACADEGRSIALVGDWGSGKSTVIEILRNELSQDSETPTHVFVYDAWAHQGDSLRRAFLDDLISSLKDYLTEKQRADAVHRVWNRTETTTTTREPILRRHAKVVLLGLAVVPLGMELFQLPSNKGDIPSTGLLLWNNILALGLITAPVLLAAVFGLINWTRWQDVRRFFFGESCEDPNFSVLSFFLEKVQGDVERKEIKSPMDSIGTFREVFSQVVNYAHACRKNLRFVIIIDNIDRIPAEQAREFWSTMQTFFSEGGGRRKPRSMRYWLIAPFSVEALSFIFGDSALGAVTARTAEPNMSKDEPDASRSSTGSVDDAKMRAKAYIDKTFGLAFYVPPPILSNWRSYFLTCLKEAFFEHAESELEAVRDVYDFGSTGTGFLTPRDIKLFTNSLVALYRQRGNEIPLTMMGTYLLHREEIVGAIIPDGLLEPRERRAIGIPNWQAMMVALHFGVPLDEGEQLLLHDPIVRALREGSDEDLQKLEARPGFCDVLRSVVIDELDTSEAEDGMALAHLAQKLDALESEISVSAQIWRDIGGSLKNVKRWSGLQESPADGIAVIIKHVTDTERLDLCRAASSSLSRAKPSETENTGQELHEFAKNWAITAKAILDGSGAAKSLTIGIPSNTKLALEIIRQMSDLDIDRGYMSAFEVSISVAEMSKAMAADIKAGTVIPSPSQFVDCVARAMRLDLQWREIGAAVSERMRAPDLNENEVRSHLGLLVSAYGCGAFPDALKIMKQLSHQGHLSHLYHRCRGSKRARAVIIAATVLANPTLERPNQTDESQEGDSALNKVIDAPEQNTDLVAGAADVAKRSGAADVLCQIGAGNQKVSRLVSAMIGSIAESGYQFGMAAEAIVENWNYVEENADLVSPVDFLKCQKDLQGLRSFIASQPFEVHRAGLYRATTQMATDSDDSYWTFLEAGILSVGKDDWARSLASEEGPYFELVQLAKKLKKAGREFQLQVPARDAVLALVRTVADGERSTSDEMRDQLSTIIGLLQSGIRRSLIRDITEDMMGQTNPEQTVRLVEVAGDEITLEEENDPERITRRVFSPLLTLPTERTIRWMKGVIERKGKTFWSLPDEANVELASRLKGALALDETQEETARSSLLALAHELDIDLTLQEPVQSETQSE